MSSDLLVHLPNNIVVLVLPQSIFGAVCQTVWSLMTSPRYIICHPMHIPFLCMLCLGGGVPSKAHVVHFNKNQAEAPLYQHHAAWLYQISSYPKTWINSEEYFT